MNTKKKLKLAKVIDLPQRFETLSEEEQSEAKTTWIRAKMFEWLEQVGESMPIDKAVIVIKTADGETRWKSLMTDGYDDVAALLEKAKYNVFQTEFYRNI